MRSAVELGDALYLVARDRVTIERGGLATATVPAPSGDRWAEALAMPALDGDAGAWVVARTAAGALWRVTASGELEAVHDRLGLAANVRSIGVGGTTVALALDDGVAVVRDRAHLSRFPREASEPGVVSASRDRVAIRRGSRLEVWNLADGTRVAYVVPDALDAGFVRAAGHGTLVVATRTALFVESADGLHRLPAPAELRALAIAGSRLWVATASAIFVVEGERYVPTRVAAAATDQLLGLAGGGAVLVTPSGLARLSLDPDEDPRWTAEVEPIVQRVCLRCHGPGGSAGVDLSSAAAWRAERAELVDRVVGARTMPPAGIALGEADRRTLADWLARDARAR